MSVCAAIEAPLAFRDEKLFRARGKLSNFSFLKYVYNSELLPH